MPQRPAAPSVPAAVAPPTAPALVQVDSDSDSSQPGPAILISPVKARAAKRGIATRAIRMYGACQIMTLLVSGCFPQKNRADSCIFRGFKSYLALICLEWLLMVGAFHILLIFWQRYISIQSFSHGTNEFSDFYIFLLSTAKEEKSCYCPQ